MVSLYTDRHSTAGAVERGKGAAFGAVGAVAAVGVVHVTAKVFNIARTASVHSMNFINSGVNKVTLFKAAAHGLARGAIQSAQGGSFKAGFMSGLSSGFDVGTKGYGGFVGRTVAMGVVGGTASALGGGKFSNGAMSGAFTHMFNAEGGSAILDNKYNKIEERIKSTLLTDKNAIINLSNDDLSTISRYMNKEAINSTDNYVGAMGRNADTFLRTYSNASFSALGSVWKGGHINYIGVGAYNTVYTTKIGAMILNPIENIMWNTGQYINSGFSSGDMGDIPSNRFWMDYGSIHGQ